jgi:putative sterol carrier protein
MEEAHVAVVFASPEWVQQFQAEVNRSEAYASSGKTWEGDFYFVVEPPKPGMAPTKMYMDLWHGKCRDAYVVTDQDGKKPEFTIAGSVATYRRIFEHKLDPIQALMTRQLKLQGNMMKIMRAVKATLDLVACGSKVDTAYPES